MKSFTSSLSLVLLAISSANAAVISSNIGGVTSASAHTIETTSAATHTSHAEGVTSASAHTTEITSTATHTSHAEGATSGSASPSYAEPIGASTHEIFEEIYHLIRPYLKVTSAGSKSTGTILATGGHATSSLIPSGHATSSLIVQPTAVTLSTNVATGGHATSTLIASGHATSSLIA